MKNFDLTIKGFINTTNWLAVLIAVLTFQLGWLLGSRRR